MSSEGRSIKDIKVEDVQKRRIPSKHYVYVINVLWSDGKRYIVYRRYSRFFDFQLSLLEKFPIDAGVVDPEKRIIPFLPGKIIFGRSHIREVALKRLGQIDEYCKALINLPPHISRDEEVFDFFEPDDDDFNPPTQQRQKQKTADNISGPTLAEQYVVIADYEKVDKWDLNLKAGMTLEVVEKSDSGWWFVNVDDKQGWVPSTYLERKDGLKENTAIRTNLGEDERYLSTENYTPVNSDEIGLEKGAVVEVLEKNLDGWWFVRCNNKEGIVPSTYLMKTEKAHIERVARASGVQIVGRLSDVSDLLKKSASSESVGDTRGNVQHILKKQRSLERGGSLRPPPRLNSITKASDDVLNSLKRTEAHYITISEFTDSVGDGVTFGKGEVVEVFEKSDSGWWFVKINGKEGWAPATYIEKTHMVEIEEEDNVYHDIDNVDEAFQSSDEDEGIYEVPHPVPEVQENKNEHKHEDTNDHGPAVPMRTKVADLRGAVIRPNSKPPPPPVGLRPVTIDEDDKSLSGGPPVPPLKSSKDKPVVNNQNFTDVLKSKLSSVGPPPPPPKNLKPMKEKNTIKTEALSPDATRKNLNNAENKTRNNQEPEEPKRYKYTDVIPKEQRQSTAESLADVLKSKFENKQDSGNKTNQPDDMGDNLSQSADLSTLNTGKETLYPQKKFEKPKPPKKNLSRLSQNHPRPVSKENSFEHKKGENCDANTTMGELKAKFEKHPPASAKKPMLKSKPNIPVDGRTSINKKPCVEIPSDSQDVRPVSGTASALKAMFEQSKTNLGAQQKTRNSSTGSNSSRTSNIAAKFNAVNESDNKCENTSRPPVLPSKPKMAVKPSPLLPHKPVQSNSTKAALPAKTNSSKPTTSNKPKVPIPSKVDKNHNEMESKEQGKLAGLTKTIASKIESNHSMNKTVPVPPGKDYEMLSNFSTPCYKAVADYTATNQEEVSICAGEVVDVIEQTKDWWFVRVRGEEGWAPGSYIEECEIDMNDDVFHKQYKAVSDFATAADGEIGLKTGDLLEVIEETDTGWWFVKNGGLEGWAPSAYLEPV